MRLYRRVAAVGFCAALLILAGSNHQSASAGAEDAELFKKNCMACHTVEKDGPRRQGPNLWSLFERPIGAVAGFPYSAGLKNDSRRWDAALLDRWLENPKSVFADTYMIYKQPDPAIRKRLIDYLESVTSESE